MVEVLNGEFDAESGSNLDPDPATLEEKCKTKLLSA